jgi:hypothetical protein
VICEAKFIIEPSPLEMRPTWQSSPNLYLPYMAKYRIFFGPFFGNDRRTQQMIRLPHIACS